MGPAASNALWRALLLSATLLAPLASHGPAASTPRPIRAPYQWIAALPRHRLRGGGDGDVQMRAMDGVFERAKKSKDDGVAAVRFLRDSAGSELLTEDGGVRKLVTRAVRLPSLGLAS
ncbi:hypothetical protein T484DRAFT_3641097 [Baffinella frigidus]|nr:hypothetical protein T484DRAFT_3641097 [Cryptophyta sp. CCMP2293]